MTSISTPISSTAGLTPGASISPKSTESSTADIISSFKEILSVMTTVNSLSASGQSAGTGMNMGDLMAPLMMLMIERLIEQQLHQGTSTPETNQASAVPSASASSTTGTEAAATSVTGSKPQPSGRPVSGGWISQGSHTGHVALDFAVPVGTSVKSTMDGKVVSAGWNDQGYGNLVIVENGNYRTYYAHLSSIPVSVGDPVAAGTTVGISGNTGHSTGPHLHYEIRKDLVRIDPTSVTLGAS